MVTLLDWTTIQIQQQIKQIQLGMTNLKVSAELLCGLTKKMQASLTVSTELRLMSYLQWIQTTVKCRFTLMVKRLQTYKPIMQLVNVARWFMKQMTWLQVNIPSNLLTKLEKLLQLKVSTRSTMLVKVCLS